MALSDFNTVETAPDDKDINWSDPAHVEYMIHATVLDIGNLAECWFADDEAGDADYIATTQVALDAIPNGEKAVRAAIEKEIRRQAERDGNEEYLFPPKPEAGL